MNLDFYNVGRFCSRIDRKSTNCSIDLSSVKFFSPFALLYLGMYLRHHSARHRFTVTLPDDQKAREYLARQQFWKRFNFSAKSIEQENLHRFTTSTSLNDIVDIEKYDYIGEEVSDMVRQLLLRNGCYSAPEQIALMAGELADNFAQHSRTELAALSLQYYPRLGILKLAIADCGIGIRQSLCENSKHKWLKDQPHHIAAIEAFKPGVSRKHEGGIGFLDVLNGVKDLSGHLLLATGDEYISLRKEKKPVFGLMQYELSGVQIELNLPVGRLVA